MRRVVRQLLRHVCMTCKRQALGRCSHLRGSVVSSGIDGVGYDTGFLLSGLGFRSYFVNVCYEVRKVKFLSSVFVRASCMNP